MTAARGAFIAGHFRSVSSLVALAAAVLGGMAGAKAQPAWPQRPDTLIVSQSAGASPDVFARLISAAHVEYETANRHYAHVDCPATRIT